jgi:hypothetical protein
MTEQEKIVWKASPPDDVFDVISGIRVVEKVGRTVGIEITLSETN